MEITAGIPPITEKVKERATSILFRLNVLGRSTTVTNTRTSFRPHSQIFHDKTSELGNTWDITTSTTLIAPKFNTTVADSLASVHSLTDTATSSNRPSVLDTRTALDLLSDVASVHIFWIRGHSGIPGIERADHLAKSATTSGTPLSISLPTSVLKSILSPELTQSARASQVTLS